jgi:ABC-type phosphate/phosphonate transport system substrate-binding protein
MRRSAAIPVLIWAVPFLTLVTGCQSAPLRLLNLVGINKEPVVIALVADRQPDRPEDGPLAILDPFAPYAPLQALLRDELGRPVGMDLCFPLQLAPGLDTGMFHLAIMSPLEYARLPERDRCTVVAVPVDESGQPARPAVLVVAAGSEIQSVEQLCAKTVAFGPLDDPRTHLAALELLAQHGLKESDLSLELLPLPGSLKHLPTMRAVAQSVMNASSDAGFLDEAAFEAFPVAGEEENDPARDRLRVIARTSALPDQLVVSSPKLDAATMEKVRAVLLEADRKHTETLRPLHIGGFRRPSEELLRTCGGLVAPPVASSQPAQ